MLKAFCASDKLLAVLAKGVFCRTFDNRRQIPAYLGLAPTPFRSGEMDRDRRINRAATVAPAKPWSDPPGVSSQPLMEHSCRVIRRMRYGPGSSRCATTTEAVRRAMQHSQESLRSRAKRYGVDPKTIAKWRARTSFSDLPTGSKAPRSTVLSAEEEAVVVAFRRHTLLPLDDCLYALQPTIPPPDALVPSPVSATQRDLQVAPGRRRGLRQAEMRGTSCAA